MIGGIAAGIAVGTLLVLFGAFVWYRRLRKWGKSSEGEVKVSKSEYPYVNVDYGTGPVPHHTPSLPPLPLPSPSPPASPSPSHVVSVSPTETESLSLRGGLTLSSTNSRTRLVLHDHDFGSEAGPSELGHSVSEVGGSESMKSVAVPTFYPPVTPFGEDSIWRNSGQVGIHFSPFYREISILTDDLPRNRVRLDPYRDLKQPQETTTTSTPPNTTRPTSETRECGFRAEYRTSDPLPLS